MATSVGLNFQLTAAVDKFEKSMADVNAKLGQIEKSSQQTATGMKVLAGIEVGKLIVGGLTKIVNIMSSGVSTLTQFASQAADAADAIGKLSTATGMAEEPLQVFTQIAAYGGVSSTQFGDALQKMSKGLGEAAQGSGTAKKALDHLGIPLNSLLKMSPEQQFMKLAAAIDDLKDPTEKSAVAAELFGKSGTKLIPMFEDIEANAKATSQEMLSLGQILSGSQVDAIESMNDSFEKVRKTAFKIGSQVVANFAPALEEANNALLQMIKDFEYQGHTGGQGLANFLTKSFFDFAQTIATVFDTLVSGISNAIGLFLQGIGTLITDFGTTMAALLGADHELLTELDWTGIQLKSFGKRVSQTETNMAELVANGLKHFGENSNEAAKSLASFGLVASDTESSALSVTDAFNAVSDYLPTFEGVASKTADTLGLLSDPSNAVKASFDFLNTSAVDIAARFGITSKQIAEFGSKLLYSQSLTSQFGQVAGNFATALSTVFSYGPTVVANGLNSLAGGLLNVLEPLGYTRDKIIQLGQAAEAHKDFKQTLIDNAMADWDSVAKQRLQYYINQGKNPFEMFHAMYGERQARLEQVTGKVNEAENKWIQATGGLTGQMEITTDGIKAAGEKLGEKLAEAGEAAMDAFEGVSDFFGGLFDSGQNLMPELEELGPELEKQTSTLDGILEAAKGFGANFVLASF